MANDDFDFSMFSWMNKPARSSLEDGVLSLTTEPDTDFWQRTHYGFRRDNGHAFVMPLAESFSFSVVVEFFPASQYDQCGIILYADADNWAKVSVEYEDDDFSRMGSVVTNLGYSDWATTDISSDIRRKHYRISRKGQDFLVEQSDDGVDWRQMRVFHMHRDLVGAMVGVYACSPSDERGFDVVCSDFRLTESAWIEG